MSAEQPLMRRIPPTAGKAGRTVRGEVQGVAVEIVVAVRVAHCRTYSITRNGEDRVAVLGAMQIVRGAIQAASAGAPS